MINGNLQGFLDDLFLGEELEVKFCGKRYFIQGYTLDIGTPRQRPHMEMFEISDDADGYVWERDGKGKTMAQLAAEFLKAKVWDGMDFNQAEAEAEWVD